MNDVEADGGHQKWLAERIAEAKTIKPGMSRAALLKVFDVEAGFQSMLPTRYVLKSCPMIKIEVRFQPGIGGQSTGVIEPIGTVSRLYLDNVITD